jgi:competence protein ComGF
MDSKGFTMIEFLVSILISIMILQSITMLLHTQLRQSDSQQQSMDYLYNGSSALVDMTDEINASYALREKANFKSLSQDVLILSQGSNRIIIYYLKSDGVLIKAISNGAGFGHIPLAYGINSIKFTYDNSFFVNSRYIEIELGVENISSKITSGACIRRNDAY